MEKSNNAKRKGSFAHQSLHVEEKRVILGLEIRLYSAQCQNHYPFQR